MMTELLTPGYSNISCTEVQRTFSDTVVSTELEASIEKKKDNVFSKRLQLLFFNLSCNRERKIISQY